MYRKLWRNTGIRECVPDEERKYVRIEIRRAQPGDEDRIWQLLHAEGLPWDDGKIAENLADLFVLTQSSDIIAVMHGVTCGGELCVKWIAVHPMYPQGAVSAALRHAISGAVLRKTEVVV